MLRLVGIGYTSPYGRDHVDANAVPSGYFSTLLAVYLGLSYVLHLLRCYLTPLLQHGKRMPRVLARGDVFKIIVVVIRLIPVYVVDVMTRRTRPNERRSHHSVNSLMPVRPLYGERHKTVPVRPHRRPQYPRGVLVRGASQYFADYRLADADLRRDSSRADALTMQTPYERQMVLVERALRLIRRTQAAYTSFVADLVQAFKAYYRAPAFHLMAPIS